MSIIKIKNFGPLGENSETDDGLFTVKFSPVTVFIGYQASGKSTIAKLFSIFTWLEKKIFCGDILNSYVNIGLFRNSLIRQEISEYLTTDTKIVYIGERYNFEYEKNFFKVITNNETLEKNYILPKIQYVSSARNLLTILYKIGNHAIIDQKGSIIESVEYIPYMVRNLNEEYIKALLQLTDTGFELPIHGTKVFHKEHFTFIKTKDKKISMSATSSGIQSIVPLLIVSSFLSKEVQKSLFEKIQSVSSNLKKRIENNIRETKNDKLLEIFDIYQIGGEESLDANFSQYNMNSVNQLDNILKKFLPSCFINIVEEPEQNLFPQTQVDILYELLKYKNENENNKLIISTHSPYILTALNNAILAKDIIDKQKQTIEELPKNKMISFEDVSAYKLENGNIISIRNEENRMIDAYQIDDCSTEINEIFEKLMELKNNEQ